MLGARPDVTLGLVLAGGAARGAYAAGVMRFLYRDLPRRLGHVPWPDVVTGTSVGALNGVFAASQLPAEIDQLTERWRTLTIPQVYDVPYSAALKLVRSAFQPVDGAGLLDPGPLLDLVRRAAPMGAVQDAIDRRACRALVVGTTAVASGYNILFLDTAADDIQPHPLPGARVRRVRIRHRHLVASAAIPILFPPVRVDGELHVDGGLRHNTPMRPAVWCGSDRVLIVGASISKEAEGRSGPLNISPTLPFLAGKALNALFLDPVERDLKYANKITNILEWGRARYGDTFVEDAARDLGVRPIRTLFLQPSQDLGRVAYDVYRESPPDVSGAVARLLAFVADQSNDPSGESDLLSYLLFDGAYTARCEALGYADAASREEELADFLA